MTTQTNKQQEIMKIVSIENSKVENFKNEMESFFELNFFDIVNETEEGDFRTKFVFGLGEIEEAQIEIIIESL